MTRARSAAGLSQAALAERMGTMQSAIARPEGRRVSPSVKTLRRYGVGKQVRVEFVLGGRWCAMNAHPTDDRGDRMNRASWRDR